MVLVFPEDNGWRRRYGRSEGMTDIVPRLHRVIHRLTMKSGVACEWSSGRDVEIHHRLWIHSMRVICRVLPLMHCNIRRLMLERIHRAIVGISCLYGMGRICRGE